MLMDRMNLIFDLPRRLSNEHGDQPPPTVIWKDGEEII